MDGQKVEISMKSGKDGIFLSMLDEIRSGWGKEMRTEPWDQKGRSRQSFVTRPYLPASLKVARGKLRPMAIISPRSSTLQILV